MRGYLWENLKAEIAGEFAQAHPLVQVLNRLPFSKTEDGWHVEGELGDMDDARLEPQKSTAAVRDLRALRRSQGICLDCDAPRHPKSKVYCATHRECDRQRAEEKRKRAGKTVRGRYKERGMRERLPETRAGTTQKFKIIARNPDGDGTREIKGYVQTGLYEDGRLGEIFIRIGKPGASEAIYDQLAVACSVALQHGASVDELFGKFVRTDFEPSGAVLDVAGISRCSSPLDLVARYLIAKHGGL